MKKRITLIVFSVLIIVALYVLYCFNYIPHKKYTNADFNIEAYKSNIDKDNDGIDDQTDILNNANNYIKTNPKYKSKYYNTGYPNDEYGVCTDVVAFALKDAGYDLMVLVNEDIPLELVARVKSQLRRYTQLGSTAISDNQSEFRTGGLVIRDDLKEVTVDGEKVKLTPIEYNILLLLVKNQGKVFSINQIYENIWNEEAIGADNTVAVHIRHIREKIEINPKEPRYLKVVWGVGYKVEKIG